MKITEKQIEESILEYLNNVLGIDAWKINNVGIYDKSIKSHRKRGKWEKPGIPDIQGWIPGKLFVGNNFAKPLYIEVKTDKGKVSLAQENFIKRAVDLGFVAFVARSVGEVKLKLVEFGLKLPLESSKIEKEWLGKG